MRCAPLVWALLAAVLPWDAAHSDPTERLVVNGLQDVELLETDAGSRLLSRNDGDPAGGASLRLWTAGDLGRGLEAVAMGHFQAVQTPDGPETDAELEQAFLRWTTPGAAGIVIDAGRVVSPFGNFGQRYLSSINPLIGHPDSYDVSYPHGVVLTGRVSRFDWRAAFLDRPLANEKYVPAADAALRPGIGLGLTPVMGLRVGGYLTRGPYLGREVEPLLPSTSGWRDFDQRVSGVELQFSRGHFELNGDLAWASYEVPTRDLRSRGHAWFVEPKYTWTPRLYTALRVEANDYPFIRPESDTFWLASNAAFYDVELGAGWRFSRGLLLKASYRRDRWLVDEDRRDFFPDGHALALQLSYAFDVVSWFDRPLR